MYVATPAQLLASFPGLQSPNAVETALGNRVRKPRWVIEGLGTRLNVRVPERGSLGDSDRTVSFRYRSN